MGMQSIVLIESLKLFVNSVRGVSIVGVLCPNLGGLWEFDQFVNACRKNLTPSWADSLNSMGFVLTLTFTNVYYY